MPGSQPHEIDLQGVGDVQDRLDRKGSATEPAFDSTHGTKADAGSLLERGLREPADRAAEQNACRDLTAPSAGFGAFAEVSAEGEERMLKRLLHVVVTRVCTLPVGRASK